MIQNDRMFELAEIRIHPSSIQNILPFMLWGSGKFIPLAITTSFLKSAFPDEFVIDDAKDARLQLRGDDERIARSSSKF
ncbi:hypothetical protein CEXT_245781 [Caerostris extrusa]|uniref:Uncharacterized protein n=1 Tax=Caerostris extrusa TaxID=172846 RepID=A0AAV4RVE2_CAEEX|nr:hypothetical protein CEXT_245781 [Caerostris extrusa]